jgi:thiamine pyrophosphokinase
MKHRNPALLICNGVPPSKRFVAGLARRSSIIVAADGGANLARQLGVTPGVIIGDFDSLTGATRRHFPHAMYINLTRQDNTDLEKALDFLVARGVEQVNIVAATGNRIDFTLGNISVLWAYTGRIGVRLCDDAFTAMPVGRKTTMNARRGTTVSLIPFGPCSGITLRGLQYPLTDATMRTGEIGVSNVVTRPRFSVNVKKGNMLLVLLRKPGAA